MLSILCTCWIADGEWEVRVEDRDGTGGQRQDSLAHPVNVGLMTRAKVRAAHRLGVPPHTLVLAAVAPKACGVSVCRKDGMALTRVSGYADSTLFVFAEKHWIVLVRAGERAGIAERVFAGLEGKGRVTRVTRGRRVSS